MPHYHNRTIYYVATTAHKLFGDVYFTVLKVKQLAMQVSEKTSLEGHCSCLIPPLLITDFKYWEDGSDEYHPLQGSLLPLWKFRPEISRHLTVSDLCCSPVLPDLFAAAYTGLTLEQRERIFIQSQRISCVCSVSTHNIDRIFYKFYL